MHLVRFYDCRAHTQKKQGAETACQTESDPNDCAPEGEDHRLPGIDAPPREASRVQSYLSIGDDEHPRPGDQPYERSCRDTAQNETPGDRKKDVHRSRTHS